MPFLTIRVSRYAHQLIQDLEAAHYRMFGIDPMDRQASENAYAALNQRRKEVYEYLHRIEAEANDPKTPKTVLRFD